MKITPVQWLGLGAFTAEGVGSIPGCETKPQKPHSVAKKIKITPYIPIWFPGFSHVIPEHGTAVKGCP